MRGDLQSIQQMLAGLGGVLERTVGRREPVVRTGLIVRIQRQDGLIFP